MTESTFRTRTRIILVLCLLGFGVVVARNAWLSDDAYITFRTVDNLIHGYGLTWNVTERVQAYTHPLWMFLMSGLTVVTREVFFTAYALCMALSLLAVYVLVTQVADSFPAALWGIAALTFSKAFVDYSTSGLENPLTHLILAGFLAVYLGAEDEIDSRTLLGLALLTALGMVNRIDTALFYLPALAYAMIRARAVPIVKRLTVTALGFAPLLAWELFSLVYYGAPVPNTAFAKLNLGLITRRDLLPQGLDYLLDSLRRDPLTLVVIAAGVVVPLVVRAWHNVPVIAGFSAYVLYVVSIGGGFMSGRFLSAQLLAAVAVLVSLPFRFRPAGWGAALAPVLILGLLGPNSTVLTTPESRAEFDSGSWYASRGISDEAANYYPSTGLVPALRGAELPEHDWVREGRAAGQEGPTVVTRGSVGFFGYYAGPQVHVIDLLGLADPLLARLPPTSRHWRVGHYGRTVPDGYVDSLAAGENRIEDDALAAYYDKLAFVIQGDLFDPDRLVEVGKLNLGAYDDLLDTYAYARGPAFTQHLRVINPTDHPYVYAYVWNGAAEAFLLDSVSEKGDVYELTWTITAEGVAFDGPVERNIASLQSLTDAETLNVGVWFSEEPEVTPYVMFERRFWFRIEDDRHLTVLLPGREWHNPQAHQTPWERADIDDVLMDAVGD
jgi:arabinofuranosyltransferase